MWIASAMDSLGDGTGMWDEEDGFFYDVLRLPDGRAAAAQGPVDGGPAAALRGHDPRGGAVRAGSRKSRSGSSGSWRLAPSCAPRSTIRGKLGVAGRRLMSIMNETRLRRVLAKMLDENEFLSPYGLRSRLALPRRASVCHLGRRPGQSGRVSARGVRQRTVRRQLELARPDLDAGQRPDHPGAAAVPRVTTATTSRSSARRARVGR